MDRRRIIERVAAGLRRCKTPPDYLIWVDDKEWVWDEETILNIPVIVIGAGVQYTPYGNSDLNFIPAWKDLSKTDYYYDFERGYEEG